MIGSKSQYWKLAWQSSVQIRCSTTQLCGQLPQVGVRPPQGGFFRNPSPGWSFGWILANGRRCLGFFLLFGYFGQSFGPWWANDRLLIFLLDFAYFSFKIFSFFGFLCLNFRVCSQTTYTLTKYIKTLGNYNNSSWKMWYMSDYIAHSSKTIDGINRILNSHWVFKSAKSL